MSTALRLPDSIAQTQVTGPRISVTFVNKQAANPIIRSYSAVGLTVRANRELQHRECERPSERSTRHLEIALPTGVTYNAGDHLGIVPRNGLDQIQRVLLRFKLDASLYLTITPRANASTYLPVNEPAPLLKCWQIGLNCGTLPHGRNSLLLPSTRRMPPSGRHF